MRQLGNSRQRQKMLGIKYERATKWVISWLQGVQVTIKKNANELNNSV